MPDAPDYSALVEKALHRAYMLEQSRLVQSSWQGGPTPAILRNLAAAITALLRERDEVRAMNDARYEFDRLQDWLAEARAAALEEAAKVVEGEPRLTRIWETPEGIKAVKGYIFASDAAAAIRALKEKP